MNRPLTSIALLGFWFAFVSCASSIAQRHGTSVTKPAGDARISITGVITNEVVVSGKALGITLFVTNVTAQDLYVPKHFNSNNYMFHVGDKLSALHGDSWGATFEDFLRLRPKEMMRFSAYFLDIDKVGDGNFSVSFYNNSMLEVKRKLEETGVPFVIELSYDFGTIKVRASNHEGPATGSQPIRSETNATSSAAGSRR